MAKVKNNKKNVNKKQEKISSTITIAILICIALVALIGIVYQTIQSNYKPGYVSLKPVNVTLASGGESHKLSVDVTLGGKSKNLNKLNMENVQVFVTETIKNLDYNSIVSKDGNEYIKNILLTALKQEFGDSIENVSLSSLLTDVTVSTPEEATKNLNPSVEELLENFGWTKKK
ncbi:hypothetical protein [uncultured Tyzzerella sp.]|uniref:hypothetical protein n=1 Tax=uncultured Tyzzerella sp. TaxID=2321398 RepID=UPI00294335B3|nr:hypothetical protein [uncultured Tyzzerella sp.]